MTDQAIPKVAVLTERQIRDIVNDAKETTSMTTATPAKAAPFKPGYKTTEMWLGILTSIGALAATATNNLPPRYAAVAGVVSYFAYALSRGIAKH